MKRTLTAMTLVILYAGLLASSAVMAQSERKKSNSPAGASCNPDLTFSFSTGAQHFSFCFEAENPDGNILKIISPAGVNHLFGSEGYVVCATGSANAYAVAGLDSGWEGVFISQPGGPKTLPVTFTRQSTDGKFELAQTFNWNTAEKEILITMTLKNTSAASINGARLSRYFKPILSDDPFDDIFDRDSDSVWGIDAGAPPNNGLMLSVLTSTQTHAAFVEATADWTPFAPGPQTATKCTAIAQPVPTAPGDYAGRITYVLGTLNAGASKTVQVVYRRF